MLFAIAIFGLGLVTEFSLLMTVKSIWTGYLRNKIISAIGDYN